jgi:multidrug efflux pump
MNPSTPFIRRPVATILLTFGVAAAGAVAFFQLPVSPLPQVDFPTISVQAQLPGASPDVVATTVATPLERHLGQIADVTEMTSSSTVGSVRINLQFGLDRDINGAARDVQAAINAAHADLPTSLRTNPTYRKVNPADARILILALTSDTMRQGELYDAASTVLSQKLSQIAGIGEVVVGGSSLPAVRVELNPNSLNKYGIGLEDVRAALASTNAHAPMGAIMECAKLVACGWLERRVVESTTSQIAFPGSQHRRMRPSSSAAVSSSCFRKSAAKSSATRSIGERPVRNFGTCPAGSAAGAGAGPVRFR